MRASTSATGASGAAQTGRQAVLHSREFGELVKSIGECRSKQEEDRIMSQEVITLKREFASPALDKSKMREYLLRLVYVEMLGHDASFAYIHVVNACSDKNWMLKKIGYLATTLFLNEDSEFIIMLVNTIMKDLRDDNFLVVCAALHAVCRLINIDTVDGFMPLVVNLLKHPKELVKKKAVMALHRFIQVKPNLKDDLDKHLRVMLCDKDPSVMGAALCALHEVARDAPEQYKNLVPSFVSILKQVAEHRLPKSYDYHKTPAPFIQVRLLKILALLGVGDRAASEHMYTVLADVMRRGNTGHTIGNAVVYECVRTITAIHPNATLLQSAAEMVSNFLRSSSHNLKYIGIDSLAAVVAINPKYAQEQQMAVIDCLEDPDESLKKKTLELLYKMTKPSNVEVIVERMLNYMSTTTDPHSKSETSTRIAELAERYAPDNSWFIEVMNNVFRLGGDAVDPVLGSNIMRIIAEGAGDDDEQADAELRSNAVSSYTELLDLPKISDVLLKVICWVLGEYGAPNDPERAYNVITKLVALVDQQTISDSAKGYLLSALAKLCCQTGASLTRDAEVFVRSSASSRNADLQQRALEIQALLSCDAATKAAVLPADASCEDLEINPDLPFLNEYVNAALRAGAAPYISQEERDGMGIVRSDHHDVSASGGRTSGLRFEAYETAVSPEPVMSELHSSNQAMPSSSSGQAAVASSAQPKGPQLNIAGPRKWGPVQYAPAPTPAAQSQLEPQHAAPDVPPAAASTASHQPPPADDERSRLASALFGGGGEATRATRGSRSKTPAPAPALKPAPAPEMDLLLDLDDTPSVQSAAAAAPAAVSSSPIDLLAELGDLTVESSAPPPNPMDMFGPGPGSSAPGMFGGGMAPINPGMGAQPVMMMPMGGGMAPGMPQGGAMYGGMTPAAAPAAPKPKPSGPKLGEKPKHDPFADLLS